MAKAAVAGGPIGVRDEPLPDTSQGVSSPEEKDPQQTLANEQITEEVQAQIDKAVEEAKAEIKQEYEGAGGHLANVRSQLATQANEREEQFTAERGDFEDTIHQLSVKDMDDSARATYERDLYRERAGSLANQLQDTRAALDASKQMGSYVRGLVKSFDVDIDDLDLDDVNKLSETAFTAAANAHQKTLQELADATEKIQTLEATTADTSPSEAEKAVLPKAPDVTTQTGPSASEATSLLDLRKSLSQGMDNLISEETLFDLAENPEETGVDLNVVLEALQAEIDALEVVE